MFGSIPWIERTFVLNGKNFIILMKRGLQSRLMSYIMENVVVRKDAFRRKKVENEQDKIEKELFFTG